MKIKVDFRATQLVHTAVLYFLFVEAKETLIYLNRNYRKKKENLLNLIPDKKSKEKLRKLNFQEFELEVPNHIESLPYVDLVAM